MQAKEVDIVKEVERSDGLWRFFCGDVLLVDIFLQNLGKNDLGNAFWPLELKTDWNKAMGQQAQYTIIIQKKLELKMY